MYNQRRIIHIKIWLEAHPEFTEQKTFKYTHKHTHTVKRIIFHNVMKEKSEINIIKRRKQCMIAPQSLGVFQRRMIHITIYQAHLKNRAFNIKKNPKS